MTVQELIKKLQRYDPTTIVALEMPDSFVEVTELFDTLVLPDGISRGLEQARPDDEEAAACVVLS